MQKSTEIRFAIRVSTNPKTWAVWNFFKLRTQGKTDNQTWIFGIGFPFFIALCYHYVCQCVGNFIKQDDNLA
jgi:hypothetical protein